MGARSARFTYAPIHQWGIPPFDLVRHGAVRPNNVPEKKKRLRALGMGCGHLASASELSLEQQA